MNTNIIELWASVAYFHLVSLGITLDNLMRTASERVDLLNDAFGTGKNNSVRVLHYRLRTKMRLVQGKTILLECYTTD
jgi:hypothetical protein